MLSRHSRSRLRTRWSITPRLVAETPVGIVNLVRAAFGLSGGEARRLVLQGAVSLDGVKVTDPKATIDMTDGAVLKAGKRKFAVLRVVS